MKTTRNTARFEGPGDLTTSTEKVSLVGFSFTVRFLNASVQSFDHVAYGSLILIAQLAKFNSKRIRGGVMNYFSS